MSLDQIILKAIPVNEKCAIEEQYNKVRREALKKRIEQYVSEQLETQFNARSINQDSDGVVSSQN